MKTALAATLFLFLFVFPSSTGCTHSNKAVPDQQVTRQRSISDIAHDSLKSVVTVVTSDATGQPLEQGSGFIVTSDGKIVTNYHVIAGAASAVVKLADSGVYAVEGIVGADKEKDLAVLKLHASERVLASVRRFFAFFASIGEMAIFPTTSSACCLRVAPLLPLNKQITGTPGLN